MWFEIMLFAAGLMFGVPCGLFLAALMIANGRGRDDE